MRILIADDEEIIRELLKDALQPLGHEIHLAADGIEALRLVEEVHPGIIILDVNMPGMDGYGVLDRLKSMDSQPHVFVLMLTAKSDLAELERGLRSGADDYLAKPFQLRELIARTQAAVRIRTLQEELHLRNRQLGAVNSALGESLKKEERLNRRMMLEMEVAVRLQKGLLSPARLDMGKIQACARYKPSTQIGGDFYDLRPHGPGRASIFLADAVGHGVSAALLAAMLKTTVEDALASQVLPSRVLASLNRSFQFCSDHGKYLTAFCGLLDCESGNLIYSLAGHVPPLIFRHDRRAVERLDSPGFCLGIFEEGGYEDRELELQPGDRLFAYTDGISEASPDDQHLFGAQFPDLLMQQAGVGNEEFLDCLDRSLSGFLGASQPADDYTLLSVQFLQQSS
jgi:sigma-B regulation protein RsbU (phosphoserine phosphatase)